MAISNRARSKLKILKSFSPGKHSVPLLVDIDGRKAVYKKSSVGKKLTLAEARSMVAAVKNYHSLLKKAGVRVSEIHSIHPAKDPTVLGEHYFVSSIEQYINKRNLANIFSSSPRKKVLLTFRKMLVEIYKAAGHPGKGVRNKAGIMIDSKPQNYVLGKDGKVYFIDFYTPKLEDKSGRLYPYIERLHPTRSLGELQTRFQDKRAIFHVLLAYSIHERPDLRGEFEKACADFLNKQGEFRVQKYLDLVAKRDYSPTNLVKRDIISKIISSKQ